MSNIPLSLSEDEQNLYFFEKGKKFYVAIKNTPVAAATGVAAKDTAAINAALDAAGANGIVVFPANQNYASWGGHVIQSGQKVHLNGSTLTRQNQVESLYTGALLSYGASISSISVANGALFTVGQLVGLTNGDGTGDGSTDGYYAATPTVNFTNAAKITAINGNVLSLDATITPYLNTTGGALDGTGSTYCVTAGGMFYVGGYTSTRSSVAWASIGSGILLENGKIEGNRLNITKGRWWPMSTDIFIGANYSTIRDMIHTNAVSDVYIMSGIGNRISNIKIIGASGNGFHPGAWDGTNGVQDGIVQGCYVYDCNKDPTIGHANGAYMFSQNVRGMVYANNTVDTCGRFGLGSGFVSNDSEATFIGNIVKSCARGAFQFIGGAAATVTGNVFKQCGADTPTNVIATAEIGGTSTSKRIVISSNVFEDSTVVVRGSPQGVDIIGNVWHESRAAGTTWTRGLLYLNQITTGVNIIGNKFYFSGTPAANLTKGVYINASSEVNVEGNWFQYLDFGVDMNGVCNQVNVLGNRFVDIYDIAIRNSGLGKAISISNNHIHVNAAAVAAANVFGIWLSRNSPVEAEIVDNNTIRIEKTNGYGIYTSASVGNTQRAIIRNNNVRMTTPVMTIGFPASFLPDATVLVLGNTISAAALSNAGAAIVQYGTATGDSNFYNI